MTEQIDILLVTLPDVAMQCGQRVTDMPPLGLAYLKAYMNKAGINSRILNLFAQKPQRYLDMDTGILQVCKQHFRILGVSAQDHDFFDVVEFCDRIKRYRPDIRIIVGGYIGFSYEELLDWEDRNLTILKKENIKGPNGELVRIELFAHGALCVAVSGKCYMSLGTYNASANRGACLQNCRRSYKVTDNETGDELVIDNEYVMSPSDLCTIGFIDKLIEAGVKVFKLEGRGRSADYVYTVTKCYRDAADSVLEGNYTEEKIKEWTEKLESVYNRGFWHGGYYLGKKLGEWSGTYGSKATKEKVFVGIAKHYFPKTGIGEFHIQSEMIKTGDEILITGNTTGVIEGKVESMFVNDKPNIEIAKQGDVITFKVSERVRENDKLYVVKNKEKFQGNNKLKVVG